MECKRCNLYKTAQSVRLLGQGRTDKGIMIVGEAPGHREDDINKPFQGACGHELDGIFESMGVNRSNIYITNAVHCRPPHNRKPTKSEVKECSFWLRWEIVKAKPKFILLLGATALSAFPFFADKGNLTELRGKFYEVDGLNIMPTFHPGAILRDDRKKPILESDIKRFIETATSTRTKVAEPRFNFRLANTVDDLEEIVDELKPEKYVSLDLETEGKAPLIDPKIRVRCLGLGLRMTQWIIPFWHPESNFQSHKVQLEILKLLYRNLQHKLLIMQNGKFDSLWLKVRYGLEFKVDHDTMIMSYLLDENNPHDLKYLANRDLGAPDYDLTLAEKIGKVPLEKLARYCAYDVYYTRRLCFLYLKQLQKDKSLYRFYKQVMVPAINAYRDIEINGIYIDLKKMDQAEEVLTQKKAEMEKKLNRYGKINWNSTSQIAKLLFDEIGLNPLDKTDGGANSTAESVLKRLANKHEIPRLLIKYKEYHGLLSKFISGWKKRLVGDKLYPFFKLHGTVTGRPSCKEPNLQQTPRDPRIRSLITAPPGWSLVEFDYGQIELRIAAMLSNERAMKLAFQTGIDIHTKTATEVSGQDMSALEGFDAKEWRKKAKAINFGFVYGMGAEGFQEYARDKYEIDFTMAEAIKVRKAFFRTYKDLPPWYERQKRIARINGQVRNLAGRIRHLPDINVNWRTELQAINSPVQGLASDFTLMSVVEISRKFPPSVVQICGTVHDAILTRIKNENLDQVVPKIIKIMESPELFEVLEIHPTVPIVVNAAVGPWGEGKEYKGAK